MFVEGGRLCHGTMASPSLSVISSAMFPFSALTVSVRRQEEHPVCKSHASAIPKVSFGDLWELLTWSRPNLWKYWPVKQISKAVVVVVVVVVVVFNFGHIMY